MIHQREEHRGLNERHRAREYAGVMASLILEFNLFTCPIDGLLSLEDRRDWLKSCSDNDRRAGAYPTEDPPRVILPGSRTIGTW